MILTAPFVNLNILSNAPAQGYHENHYEDRNYNKYPTDKKKYECQKGPFEGFFVSSVEFCLTLNLMINHKDRDKGREGEGVR